MNKEDLDILKRWKDESRINFGRLPMAEIEAFPSKSDPVTHWVRFPDAMWELAWEERKKRSERMIEEFYKMKDEP